MLGVDSPLGFRPDGRPFWPYLGGSEGAPEDDDTDDGDGDEGDEGEGKDNSAKVIAAERAATKRAKDMARPWRVLAQELGVKSADEVRALLAKKPSDEGGKAVDVEAIKRQAREEVLAVSRRQIVGSAIEALAAKDFADPDDAARNLDLADYEVDDDGRVDRNRIKKDLVDLLTRKPHLKKVSTRVDFEQGPRGGKPAAGADMNTLIRRAAGRA